MNKPVKLIMVIMTASLFACNNESSETATKDSTSAQQGDTATAGWTELFDGTTLNGWRGYNKTGIVPNWTIEDSAMVCLGAAKDAHGGDIVSEKEYGDFELEWQWKMSPGGNSGVMYHVVEDSQYQAPYQTGPEYQMIDDEGFPEKLENWQKSGADYAMYTTNEKKKLNPVGQWNTSRILFRNSHVEHWLNGEKVLEFEAWSDDWNKKKLEGKWKDFKGYGTARKGRIALQDHGNKVYFKNIRIREF